MENEIGISNLVKFCENIVDWKKETNNDTTLEDAVTKYVAHLESNISIKLQKTNYKQGLYIRHFLFAYNRDVEIACFSSNGNSQKSKNPEIIDLYNSVEKKYNKKRKQRTEEIKKEGVTLLKKMISDYE